MTATSVRWNGLKSIPIIDRKTRHCGSAYDTKSKERRDTNLPRPRPIPPPAHPDDFGVAVYYEDKSKEPERYGSALRVEGNQCFGMLLMNSKHPDGPKEATRLCSASFQNEKGDLELCRFKIAKKDRSFLFLISSVKEITVPASQGLCLPNSKGVKLINQLTP